jgi:hypothetical protein
VASRATVFSILMKEFAMNTYTSLSASFSVVPPSRRKLALTAWSLAALIGLSACVYPGPHGPGGYPYPPTGQERCNAAAALAVARGKMPTTAVQQRALRAANALTVRILYKNQPVTREYLRGRLNLVVNEARVIESAYCG